jgi:hypothetical protein
VTWSSVAGAAKPALKKGGYMLEPTQMKWYRIVNFTDPVTAGANVTSTVLFEKDVPSFAVQGIFMKGVIDVYPLGTRTGTL